MPPTLNKENVDIPQNYDLSDMDKAYMAVNYPRDSSSVSKALDIIDLDAQAKLNILEAHEAHDILEMRRLLAKYSSPFSCLGTPHSITRTIRHLPASFANWGYKSFGGQTDVYVLYDLEDDSDFVHIKKSD